jgi:hypothetical protein
MYAFNVEKLMKPKIDEVKEVIENIHYQHITPGTYEGRLSDEEALKDYNELLEALPSIPGLSEEDIKVLTTEIEKKIGRIHNPVDERYNEDTITNEEEFRKAIEQIHYEHRYSAGGTMGPLTEGEACEYYRLLLNLLDKMDNLTPEVKETLRKEVQGKIDSTEKVEEAKMEDRRAVKAEEFAKAKARFNRLSSFERLKLKLRGQTPDQVNYESMDMRDLRRLYK